MMNLKNKFNIFLKELKLTNKSNILKFIKELIINVFIIIFLKTPLVLLRELILNYFNKISSANILGNIYYWLFEILYILFAILIIRNWIIKWKNTINN